MASIENVLIVGDSNIREVMSTAEMDGYESIVAPGCSFWNSSDMNWRQWMIQPLLQRLSLVPEVKVLVVHFGTNDGHLSPQDFTRGVELFIREVRRNNERLRIVLSEILPRCEVHIEYNESGQAARFNNLQTLFNRELVDCSESCPNVSLVKHSNLDVIDKTRYWRDSIHLSLWGARLLAHDLNQEILRVLEDINLHKSRQQGSQQRTMQEEIQPTSRIKRYNI